MDNSVKNVWILNHYAVPLGVPGGTRHYGLARNLPAYGWQASIVAASVEHLTGRQRLAAGEKSRLDRYDGVRFLWLLTTSYTGNGGARIRNMLEYALRAWWPRNTRELPRPDAVIGSSVHPLAAASGALLARRFSVPFVFEVRDLWPQTLIDLGRIADHSVTAGGMRVLERWLYRRADRIVTLLPRAVDYIVPLAGVPSDKVVWIPNGVELSEFPSPPPASEGRPFTLMYFGSHGQANALENLLKAMECLNADPRAAGVVLRLVGDGPAKSSLQALARRLGLRNVSFEPPVAKADIPRLASQADAFVLSVLDKPNMYRFGISPNKMYEYLAGRRPIIVASAAINNPVLDAEAGITVRPENPAALAGAVIELIGLTQDERERMGEAGRRYVEQHNDFKVLARRLAAVLDGCVDKTWNEQI